MKGFLLLCLLFFSLKCLATKHYWASTGNDAADGLTAATAKQTLKHLNSEMAGYASGDTVLFRRSDTFYGTLTVSLSGLVFDAYGTGTNPVLTGFTTVTKWRKLSVVKNIWESVEAVSALTTCNYVLINGSAGQIARYPNSGWLTIASHTERTSVTVPGLKADYTGFKYVQRSNRTLIDVVDILSTNFNTTLYIDGKKLNGTPIDGFGCFIQNGASLVDTLNEFYFDPETKKIRVYALAEPFVQLSTTDRIINLDASNLSFNNIKFTGSNTNAVYKASGLLKAVNFHKCQFQWIGNNAIDFRPGNCSIDSCSFENVNSYALRVLNGSITVADNTIRNTGLVPGASIESGGAIAAVHIGNGRGGQSNRYSFIRNQVINTGHNPVNFGFDTGYIAFNRIDSFNLLTDDGGALYGGSNATIEHNIITNGLGTHSGTNQTKGTTLAVGIYIDDNNSNNIIRNNTVADASWAGIYIHNSDSCFVVGNTVKGGNYPLRLQADHVPGRVCCNIVKNNVVCQTDSASPCISFRSQFDDINTFAVLDSNIYHRIGITNKEFIAWYPKAGGSNLTIAGWRALSGQDKNSGAGPTVASPGAVHLEYNYSPEPRVYLFAGRRKKDVLSRAYNNTAVIGAWGSKLFFTD